MSGPVGKFAIVRLPGKLPALDTFGSCLDWKRGLIPVELWFSMCAGIGGAHATRKSIPTIRANVFSTIAMFISESQLKEIIKSPQAVAIVGAGPAGITIAMELEALGVESLLLEAGGFEFPDEEANDPYRGRSPDAHIRWTLHDCAISAALPITGGGGAGLWTLKILLKSMAGH